jgi:hypothetical protein
MVLSSMKLIAVKLTAHRKIKRYDPDRSSCEL